MERAYFGGKQAMHLPGASGKCANPPEYPWEKKRTHLSQVSTSQSAQITLLEAALNHQSCFTASLTLQHCWGEKWGEAEPPQLNTFTAGEKVATKESLTSPPSLSYSKEKGRGVLRLGRGEMGRGQMLEFKTVVWQQVAFRKMLHDSVSSEALQAEERLKNTSVITSDSLTFRQMHMLKNPTKILQSVLQRPCGGY